MSAWDEWQRKIKAEKDTERQKKKESAELLSGYKGSGNMDETMKLKAAKEEERRKKEEAQRALQGYQSNDLEQVKRAKALKEEERRRQQDAQNNLQNYKATNLEDVTKNATKRESRQWNEQGNIPIPVNAGGSERGADDFLPSISVSERAADIANKAAAGGGGGSNSHFGGSSSHHHAAASYTSRTEKSSPPREIGHVQKASAAGEDYGQVQPPTDFGHSQPGNDSNNSSSNAAFATAEPKEDEKKTDTSPMMVHDDTHLPQSSSKLRLDVLFSFGLVTVQTDPSLQAYMNAVAEVVRRAIANDANLREKVTCDDEHIPFVKSTEWDPDFKSKSGRQDVKRLVVTASAPVFLNNVEGDASVVKTREGVVEALTAAIQTGSFLKLARGK